jgi:hypothetical protein
VSAIPVVFISSTSEDLTDYRQSARDAAITARFHPEMMEYFTASGTRPPLEACLKKVEQADVVVVLVAHRYGWIPPNQPDKGSKSITWLECEQACRDGKEVLAFIIADGFDWPANQREENRLSAAVLEDKATEELFEEVKRSVAGLKGFKAWLNGRGIRTRFTTPEDLRGKVSDALRDWRSQREAAGRPSREGEPEPRATVSAAYRQWVQSQCLDIDLGIQLKQGQVTRLNQIYVPLATGAGEEEDEAPPAGPKPGARERRRPKPKLLLDLLNHCSLYVSGAPGSGKSTFCRWVAWLMCNGGMPAQQVQAPPECAESFPEALRDHLAVLVPLREFWTSLPGTPGARDLSSQQMEQALGRWWQGKKPARATWVWPDLPAHLRQGTAFVILDGVDEVPLTQGEGTQAWFPRAMLLAGLAAAIQEWVECGNRVLLTSRPYGVRETEGRKLALRPAPIDDLTAAGQALLVRRWFHILADDPAAGAALGQEMLDHLSGRAELEPLAANPMLLTAMCIIYHQGKRLPQDRYDLYTRILDLVLYNRYHYDPAVLDLVRNRLSVLAHGMHTGTGLDEERSTPHAEATYDELDHMLQAYQDQKAWTEAGFKTALDTREELLSHTGLLLPRGDRRAGFYHLSIQEFLAAQRLLDVEGDRLFEVFRARAAVAEWRNTLSFLFASQLGKSTSPERSIRMLGRLIEEGVESSLGLAVVVADCLQVLIGRKLRLRPDLEATFRRACLAAIEREEPVRERCVLALALGQLGDPRIVRDLRDPAAFVTIPAGDYVVGEDRRPFRLAEPFLLGRYLVTNSQYALFIDEKGYQNRDWWSDEGWRWRCDGDISEPMLWSSAKWNGPNQPAIAVSFWEAEAFARWAGGRLPSEYEWEAAARGPEGCEYPWGGDWRDGICNSREAGVGRTTPVGLFPSARSKAFGMEDMAGNVWEWSTDLYEGGTERVFRGGSWNFDGSRCRAAARYRRAPASRLSGLGFRVARDV